MDKDRRKNAESLQEVFYSKKNKNSPRHDTLSGNMMAVPEGVDVELLAKVLSNPEMTALARACRNRFFLPLNLDK